jgi:hypothetical protein
MRKRQGNGEGWWDEEIEMSTRTLKVHAYIRTTQWSEGELVEQCRCRCWCRCRRSSAYYDRERYTSIGTGICMGDQLHSRFCG